MQIRINGERTEFDNGLNVKDFLNRYLDGKENKGIAIARNGIIVPRSNWEIVMIEENDEIEIVHAVQGG